MAILLVGSEPLRSRFDLLGYDEDSISLVVAWTLANSPGFFRHLLKLIARRPSDPAEVTIQVHRHEAGAGITDIELYDDGGFHYIIEAKRGWQLPTEAQLKKYCNRDSFCAVPRAKRRIVTMSECSQSYAAPRLRTMRLGGTPISHISWQQLYNAAQKACSRATSSERRILLDLDDYMRTIMSSQPVTSNLTYVLALRDATEPGWRTSWIDIVRRYSRYFHPLGVRGWPKTPPNYLAFRYSGQLQSIHHVARYSVITNLGRACPGIPSAKCEPHFLYELGPAISPRHSIPNGRIWPNGRYWCAIDTLLTATSVSEAVAATKQRSAVVPPGEAV
jgi:hypothetical protein